MNCVAYRIEGLLGATHTRLSDRSFAIDSEVCPPSVDRVRIPELRVAKMTGDALWVTDIEEGKLIAASWTV
jgi:hypothetical protein